MLSWRLFTALWAVMHSFLHGFHISSLNGVQEAVVCDRPGTVWGLKKCIDLSPSQFGIVVTIYTLGGLLGSLSADNVTRRFGRIGTLRAAECVFMLGTAAVGLGGAMWIMIIGRILVGTGSGLSMVTVPLLLSEISSKRYKHSFGTLHQMAIGIGMIVAQSLSIPFAKPFNWRYVLAVGFTIPAVLFALSGTIKASSDQSKSNQGEEGGTGDEESPLVPKQTPGRELSVKHLLSADPSVKRGLLVVAASQFAQQICGISPVMYFSTGILAPVFGGDSKLVALAVMAVGIPFNFVPGLLPSSLGSKRLLLASATGTCLTALSLGFGLNAHARAISAVSVFLFVLCFSSGLAPVPWVVLSEVMPPEARTAGGAVGVSVNWMTNFAAGSVFLPLQQALKHEEKGEGNVFFVFAGASALALVGIWSAYRLYDKARE